MKRLKFFDLFAGCGGFRLGLERNGFKCVGYCEMKPYAQKLYQRYFNTQCEYFQEDLYDIKAEEIEKFDILTAGFPCQAFSYAGSRKGVYDQRGFPLWDAMFALIRKTRPIYFIGENVGGLFRANAGWALALFLNQMDKLGYDVEWDYLNSTSFGVPQSRPRVYFIGHLRGKSWKRIFPLRREELVRYEFPKKTNQFTTLKLLAYTQANIKNRVQDRKDTWTLDSSRSKFALWDGKRFRVLTPLERFRLQGFPDEMYYSALEVGLSHTEMFDLTGNTITVQIAESIGKKIKRLNLC